MTTTQQDLDADRVATAKKRADRDKELCIPNFAALREWIDKLEDWCREEAEDLRKAEHRAEDLQGGVDRLEQESAITADINAQMETMEQELDDVERGVITFEEFMDRRRRRAMV